MKKCQTCNFENVDTMRFCVECGAPLPDAPIVVNLGGGQGQSNADTVAYKSTETQAGSGRGADVLPLAGHARPVAGRAVRRGGLHVAHAAPGGAHPRAVPGAVFLVGLIFLPESPRWLLLKGLPDRARLSLQRLRGTADIDRELEEMSLVVQAEVSRKSTSPQLFSPAVRPALVIAMALFFLQQLSGINAVIYYAPQIFDEAGFDTVSTQVLATVGVGSVNLLTTVVALFLIDRIGRRRLLMTGFTGAATTLLIIAFAVAHPATMPSSIVVVMLLLYIAFFAVSLGPLPHVLMSEIFPLRVRGQGMSMASVSNWGFNFVVVLLFPVLLAGPGLAFAFSLFAVGGSVSADSVDESLARYCVATHRGLGLCRRAPPFRASRGRCPPLRVSPTA